ncbi:Glycoside Hydrolase Family 61 [Rhizoctonia solani]|uniref:AA9 family lytic polysaccharide monooxygenase n=1 Tax=Rhizoctonia solani TaxID=456999 RepID=A0A8H7M1E2_9AGAM|nr:Glycoside Hydrolase Family 61 [Rhizoctonia solani]
MRTGTVLAALAAAASTAHAHATFQYLWVNGVDQGNKYVRPPANNSPITDLSSKVAVEMHQQPGDRSCATEAIGGNHDGPTIIYMAKVDNAATAVGSDANWFKVAQTGLVSKDYWGTDVMNANCGKVEFTIPSDIPAGNYLIHQRHRGGSASPATVKFPGAYSPTDPGILFDLYGGYTSYTIPGPAVYTAGGSSGGEDLRNHHPPCHYYCCHQRSPTTTATGPLIPKYGQCGGQGWTGGTTCVAGSTCSKLNDYYSQCT